jgi:hypothetical protein
MSPKKISAPTVPTFFVAKYALIAANTSASLRFPQGFFNLLIGVLYYFAFIPPEWIL